jgi:AraC-like DNA-binding protein
MGRSHDRSSRPLAGASARVPARPRSPDSTTRVVSSVAAPLDPLSDVLRTVRLTGACFFRVQASSPWWAEVPDAADIASSILPRAQHLVSYHVVTEGRCWAGLADGSGLWAETGDVVVVPHGDCYALSTAPGKVGLQPVDVSRAFFRQLAARELPLTICDGGGGPDGANVICGFLGCDALPFNPILSMLPRLLRIPQPAAQPEDRLGRWIEFALAESIERGAGSDSVLLRISELMFVEVVRRLVQALPAEEKGWLAGLRDPFVCRALGLLHQQPAATWTLEGLARQTGLSRSALAQRFAHFVGQPPMQYLARWRMQLAARLLADGIAKVGAVARDVGYDSEAAFSRAFKKTVGTSPARWRSRQAR